MYMIHRIYKDIFTSKYCILIIIFPTKSYPFSIYLSPPLFASFLSLGSLTSMVFVVGGNNCMHPKCLHPFPCCYAPSLVL